MAELLRIMAQLRAPGGCPWDREQTFASIAPYTIEEAYEVADAIEHGDMRHLKDELGDLLFQVVFHARMAEEGGHFDFDAVAGSICDKLKRRHPHVFEQGAALSVAEQSALWEQIKAEERAAAHAATLGTGVHVTSPDTEVHATAQGAAAHITGVPPGALDGVPPAMPALMRAYKLSKRAARVGFDFEHAGQCADKVAEELAEVREAASAPGVAAARVFEEIGDLLFAAANLARKLDVDAEAALRAANAKFERRFRGMEALARARGEVFAELDLSAQERLWQAVKRGE
jgi:MazG family protein